MTHNLLNFTHCQSFSTCPEVKNYDGGKTTTKKTTAFLATPFELFHSCPRYFMPAGELLQRKLFPNMLNRWDR